MIKNAMEVTLLKIELADVDEWEGNPGGSAFFEVNGKTVEIIIHACGELDFESSEPLTEEESDAVMDFFYANEEVNKAFPGDEFP
jgi:hypothetical protein